MKSVFYKVRKEERNVGEEGLGRVGKWGWGEYDQNVLYE